MVTVDWSRAPPLVPLRDKIALEAEMKALSVHNAGRQSLSGPGRISHADLAEFRARRPLQEVIFDLARGLTKHYLAQPQCEAPPQVSFPQMVNIVRRYVEEKVRVIEPADIKDLFLAPYYGWWRFLESTFTQMLHRARPLRFHGMRPVEGQDQQRRWIFGPPASRVR
jgi:type III restriction enzyme